MKIGIFIVIGWCVLALNVAIIAAALTQGCASAPQRKAPHATWEPIQMELGAAVWLVRVDGHDYLFTTRGNRGGLVHSASCKHDRCR